MLFQIFTEVIEQTPEVISFWSKLWNFIELNFPSVVGWTAASAGVLAGVLYIVRKALPTFMNRLGFFLANIIVSLFGGNPEHIQEGFKQLPLVQSIEKNSQEWLLEQEVKLIDLKSKLASKKLNQLERTALTYQYDMLIKEIGVRMSESTKQALEDIESIGQNNE